MTDTTTNYDHDRIALRNESLPTHGQGGYYGWSVRRGSWGKGVRLSVGGYGWRRSWYRWHWTRYPHTATHFGIGPVTFSIIADTRLRRKASK